MSLVWIVITDHIYDGDHLYGIFNSEERAKEALKNCEDEDAVIRRIMVNEYIPVTIS